MLKVAVQQDPIETTSILEEVGGDTATGAVVTFTGQVRGESTDGPIRALELEHYPGMTEREIRTIGEEAVARWGLTDCRVVHRVGTLYPGETIVLVATAAGHRADAFDAAAFLMDWLKTRAPFWKREWTPDGARWVEARASDEEAAARWRRRENA